MDGKALAALGTTVLFWASAFPGIRQALHGYTPEHLALLRFLVASMVLLLYGVVARPRLPTKEEVPFFVGAGLLGFPLYHIPLNYGEVTVTAGSASFLINTVPVFTAILAAIFLGEQLNSWGWVGISTSFVGASLIAVGERGGLTLDPGVFLILFSALSNSAYFVVQKPKLERFTALEFTSYAMWAGTALMLVFLPGLPTAVATAPASATLSVVYLGVFPAAIAYVTMAYVLSKASASVSVSFLYAIPPLTLLMSWLWLGEVPTLLSVIGGITSLTGVAVVERLGRTR